MWWQVEKENDPLFSILAFFCFQQSLWIMMMALVSFTWLLRIQPNPILVRMPRRFQLVGSQSCGHAFQCPTIVSHWPFSRFCAHLKFNFQPNSPRRRRIGGWDDTILRVLLIWSRVTICPAVLLWLGVAICMVVFVSCQYSITQDLKTLKNKIF